MLYTPLLLDHNYKLRHLKPLNVTVALPDSEDEVPGSDGNNSADDNEVTDECAVLIDSDHGSADLGLKPDKVPGKFFKIHCYLLYFVPEDFTNDIRNW